MAKQHRITAACLIGIPDLCCKDNIFWRPGTYTFVTQAQQLVCNHYFAETRCVKASQHMDTKYASKMCTMIVSVITWLAKAKGSTHLLPP